MDAHDPLCENGKYVRLETLGKGSFGFVLLARNTETQEVVAIKLLPRTEVNKYVEAEIVNHSLMRHPHVIQFREVFLTKAYICIVMEYATGGTLFQYVQRHGRLKESVARWFFQQLVVGVDYCHKRGVANRDIKLENTLLQEVPKLPLPLVKICDFGYSKAENKSAAKSKVGTLTYMAPEVLININRDGAYDGKVADIWSCGVMLYVMLAGRYPFDSPNTAGMIETPNDFIAMLERMVGRQYTLPEDISPECAGLLQQMLLPEPHRRVTVEGIMGHPWFTNNLPQEAATMNATYLNAARALGVLAPEALRRLIEEARLPPSACRVSAALSPREQAALVAQLAAEDAQAAAQLYAPPGFAGVASQLLQQQQRMLLQRLQEQRVLSAAQQRSAGGGTSAATAAAPQHQQRGQQLQAKAELGAEPMDIQQGEPVDRAADMDNETLTMIDDAISDQLAGSGALRGSAELRAFIRSTGSGTQLLATAAAQQQQEQQEQQQQEQEQEQEQQGQGRVWPPQGRLQHDDEMLN